MNSIPTTEDPTNTVQFQAEKSRNTWNFINELRASLVFTYYWEHDSVIKRVFMVMTYSFSFHHPDTDARYQHNLDDTQGGDQRATHTPV